MLGQLLLALEAISEEELRAALDEQRWTRERLGVVLVRNGAAPEDVARALARQLKLPYEGGPLDPEADVAGLVDPTTASRSRVLPLRVAAGAVIVAVEDPLDAVALDDLRFRVGRRVEPVVVAAPTLQAALDRLATAGAGGPARAAGAAPVGHVRAEPGAAHGDVGRPEGREDGAPPGHAPPTPRSVTRGGAAPARTGRVEAPAPARVVELVERILTAAGDAGASDVHVEPRPDRLLVRARIDGVLREIATLPADAAPAVVSRLKIMARLDISVKRVPQDGRATVRAGGRPIDLRVSTLPCVEGEKVVLRMLDPEHAGMGLDELGLPAAIRARLGRILLRAHGALLVTGPTGSGKTTTLYAILGSIDRSRRNVVTLEDPIEYRLPGLTQVQVQARAGLTFAAALRAVLRQDPDVVMVGEMRDPETAEVGMAAALTGHLVLSTLHTNDAAAAVSRLAEMGVPPYMIAAGLSGVLAQRLVRRLCRGCRRVASADATQLAALGLPSEGLPVHEPVGCEGCGGVGYRGRTGIFDLLEVDAEMRQAILRGDGPDRIREVARRAGAAGLADHAATRLAGGETSLAEVAPFLALLAAEAPRGVRRPRPGAAASGGVPRGSARGGGGAVRVGPPACAEGDQAGGPPGPSGPRPPSASRPGAPGPPAGRPASHASAD